MELCRDIPQYQLCHEVAEIEGSIKALTEKLRVAENSLESLMRDLARIEEDLAVKTRSLELENKCMETRQKLVDGSVTDKAAAINAADKLGDGLADMKLAAEAPQASPTKLKSALKKTPETSLKQSGGLLSNMDKDFSKTTYSVAYDEQQSVRAGDLDRTLGRSSAAKKKVVLVD